MYIGGKYIIYLYVF